jgi:hypothetical protein
MLHYHMANRFEGLQNRTERINAQQILQEKVEVLERAQIAQILEQCKQQYNETVLPVLQDLITAYYIPANKHIRNSTYNIYKQTTLEKPFMCDSYIMQLSWEIRQSERTQVAGKSQSVTDSSPLLMVQLDFSGTAEYWPEHAKITRPGYVTPNNEGTYHPDFDFIHTWDLTEESLVAGINWLFNPHTLADHEYKSRHQPSEAVQVNILNKS